MVTPDLGDGAARALPPLPSSKESTSSTSSSENSDTSTLHYNQDHFEWFRSRGERLCQILWPLQEAKTQPFWRKRALTFPGRSRILRQRSPSVGTPIIKRLRGGDSTRIVVVTLPSSKDETECYLILLVPRWGQGQGHVQRTTATLDPLRLKSLLPVASVISKDLSNNNPIHISQIIQSQLQGKDTEAFRVDLNNSRR